MLGDNNIYAMPSGTGMYSGEVTLHRPRGSRFGIVKFFHPTLSPIPPPKLIPFSLRDSLSPLALPEYLHPVSSLSLALSLRSHGGKTRFCRWSLMDRAVVVYVDWSRWRVYDVKLW